MKNGNTFLKYIKEDLSYQKDEHHKLNTSSETDDHIIRGLEFFAKNMGANLEDIKKVFSQKVAEKRKNLGNSILNKNAVENAPEAVLFDMIQSIDDEKLDVSSLGIEKRDLLDRDFFYDLTQYVLGENSQFFPLRNPYERKAVKPFFFITPDHLPLIKDPRVKEAAEHHCDTAFCTPNAEMVFNRKFCEKIALQSLLKGQKPKSKKYQSNGGPIPDYYDQLEFIMMHELLHFSAGDHFYTKQMTDKIAKKYPELKGMANDILNYVGDYINNWLLAKSGYSQLPIGLFSEDVNMDEIDSYEEVIDVVAKEMLKMSPDQRDKASKEMSDSMDDHMDNENDTPSAGGQDSTPQTPQESKNQDKREKPDVQDKSNASTEDSKNQPMDGNSHDKGDEGDKGQEGQKGQPQPNPKGPGEPKQGKGSQPSGEKGEEGTDGESEPGNGSTEDISKAIDDAMKKNHENMKNRDDGNDDAEAAINKNNIGDDKTSGGAGKAGNGSAAIEFNAEGNAVIPWKKILKKMIPKGEADVEDTYSKMSRSSTSTMVTAQQTGMGRIKPGEVRLDPNKKGLVFVIDNSGSVIHKVGEFNKEIFKLLKAHKKELDNMIVIKFSHTFEVFKVDVGKLTYQQILNQGEITNKKATLRAGDKQNVTKLFTKSYAGGTRYSPSLHELVEYYFENDMNIIMFTDDDLLNDQTFKKFFLLGKKKKNRMALFITDDSSYRNMKTKFGDHKWMTVLK